MEGFYSKGSIEITLPKMDPKLGSKFIVDVSLNGQQFTNMPSSLHLYDIRNGRVEPPKGLSEGGYKVSIHADGLFDSA